MIPFRITGLDPGLFSYLFGRRDDELAAYGVKRYVVDEDPGYPDRVEMRELEIGERALLLNYTHQAADSPYRSSHAIFVCENAATRYDRINEVPDVMRIRPLSLRAFDEYHMMVDADLVDGRNIEPRIDRFFANPEVAYIHVHNAKRGCYSGRIDRLP